MAERETTVVKTGGNGMAIGLLAVAIIIAAIVGFMFLKNDNQKTDAVSGAAQSVGQAADSVTDAAKKPAE